MKKGFLLVLLATLPLFVHAQDINLRGFEKYIEMLMDTTLAKGKPLDYVVKNSEYINGEVMNVMNEDGKLSTCLIKVYKDNNKYDYTLAIYQAYDEIIFDGKKIKESLCFLAGTFSYESEEGKTKTLPLYYTTNTFAHWLKTLKDNVDKATEEIVTKEKEVGDTIPNNNDK